MIHPVCRIYGIWEGIDPDETGKLKSAVKKLIAEESFSGIKPEEIMVFFPQDLLFMDKEEGIFCEVTHWPPYLRPEAANIGTHLKVFFDKRFPGQRVRVRVQQK